MARIKTEEAPTEETQTESTTSTPSTPETTKPEKSEPNPLLFEQFKTVSDNAVGERDLTTGELGVTQVSSVVAAYKELADTKQRNQAKNYLIDQAKASMKEMDGPFAKACVLLQEAIATPAAKPKVETKPVDPTDARSIRLATLQLGYSLVNVEDEISEVARTKASELVGSVDSAQIDAYQEWTDAPNDTRGDAPSLPAFAVAAIKLANKKGTKSSSGGRGASSYSGPRRSIENHVNSAFGDSPSGTFLKVAELAGHTSEEYGDDHPSSGAVSAYLFDKDKNGRTHDSVTGVTQDGNRGAVKN